MAVICAVTVANAYYIHPIISDVAVEFGIGPEQVGLIPALNQIALAVGIMLLLPLGDRYGNRRLVTIFSVAQIACLLVMVIADVFLIFLAASTVLGFFTIAPYLIPAYASKRVSAERLGQVTSSLTVGFISGVLLARIGAGVIAEYGSWRWVYVIAAIFLTIILASIHKVMEPRDDTLGGGEPRQGYWALIASLIPILRAHPRAILSGVIQGLNFGIFIAIWLGLALHLTSREMGYGVDDVGYLAAFGIIGMFSTPKLGKLADRIGPWRARAWFTTVQILVGILLLLFGDSLGLLIIPLVINAIIGPPSDVCGRMTILLDSPEIRTRLMTAYIMLMFLFGGLASWVGTLAYARAGWEGTASVVLASGVCVSGLSWFALRLQRGDDGAGLKT